MEKLSWNQIESLYNREWVELVDYEWIDGDAYPKSGVVRTHAKMRRDFDSALENHAPPFNSAIIFVGATPKLGENDLTRGYSKVVFE